MYCRKCGRMLGDEAVMCPDCGELTKRREVKRHKEKTTAKARGTWKLIVAIFFFLSALNAVGKSTLIMIVYLCLSGGLILWWILTDKFRAEGDD